nr:MAG TPA: receptor binding protein [Caudoviricetes sp.]
MQHTKNFNLNKPEGTDYADIEKLNENFEKIDEKLKEMDNKTQEATENEKGILTKNQVKDLAKEALPFGVGNDDVLQGTMLAKIMGLPDEGYKGLITETGEKKQGYAYYDPGTHQMYYCKKTNNQNYVDNNNFASFSNKSLLDQLENLYTIERYQLFSHLTQAIIQKIGKICILTIDSNNAWTGVTQGAVLLTLPEKFRPVEYVVSSVGQLGTHENANVQILTNGQVIYRGIQSIKGALYFNVVYFTA